MKKRLVIFGVVSLIIFVLSVSFVGAADVIGLKYGHVERIESPQHQFALYLADRVKELTDGRIIIDVFPQAQLGEVSELIDGVQAGSVEMGHHVFASLGQVHKDMPLFGLPYLYRSPEHGLAATNPVTSPLMRKFNEEMVAGANIRVIGAYTRGFRHLSCKFPVYSPADLKGKKIRGVPLPMWTSMLKGMGAIPVPVAIAEVPTALMTGLIVGQENPFGQMWASKLYETQSHIMLTGHMMDLLCIFINDDVWESIPADDKVLFEEALADAQQYSLDWSMNQRADYIKKFEEKGVTIIGEEDGLDNAAFKEAVLAQVKKDYPDWNEYIEEIQNMKTE